MPSSTQGVPISTAGPPSAVSRAKRLDGGAAGGLERRLEHQILRRIAGDEKFGEGDDVGALARGLRARRAGAFEIAGDIADDRVELRHGNGEVVCGTLFMAKVYLRIVRPGNGAVAPASSSALRSAAGAEFGRIFQRAIEISIDAAIYFYIR